MDWKRKRRLGRAVWIGVIVCAAGVALAQAVQEVWVKRPLVNVFADEGAASGKIAVVKKGDKLTVLSRDGKWLKVQVGDKQGYVFEDSISASQVSADSGLNLGSADTSGMSTASAGKGLEENADALAYGKSKNLSRAGLDQLVAIRNKVSFADWKQFMKDGQVGRGKPQ